VATPSDRSSSQEPASQEKPRFLDVGRVIGPFGLAGEVRVFPLTDFPDRFGDLKAVRVGERLRPYGVEAARQARGEILLKLSGVDDATAAESLRGELLRVPLSDAVLPPEDQYYWHQIIDLEVVTIDGEALGRVVEILRTGANDVYIVRGPRGDLLLPAIEDVIREVDLAAGRLVVELLPGLLEP
jgi:16S rRNA processing protein RimM